MRRSKGSERVGSPGILLERKAQSGQTVLLIPESAEELFAIHGKTFHFAARFFPPVYRSAVVTLYAFFRTLDDLVDERTANWQVNEVSQELTAWREWFSNGSVYPAPREPLGTALAALLDEYAIPRVLFEDFLAGLFSDLEPQEFPDFCALYRYCYQVAGTVGLAMVHVLGGPSEQALTAAKHLGIAMQLTNILRDIGSDLATERIYLPQDELGSMGSSSAHLRLLYQAQQGPDECFRAMMRSQIRRARLYYAEGLHGSWLLAQNCRLPVLLAGRLYQRILTQIERQDYDVLRSRARTSLFTKVHEAGIVFLLDHLWRRGEVELCAEREAVYEN